MSQPKKENPGLKTTKKTLKHWVIVVLFGAIIVVFALWGISPARMGESSQSGVAATVNDSTISVAEFRSAVANMEQRMRQQLEQFPEAQRAELMKREQQVLRTQALDQLIVSEVMYQAAQNRGILAPDVEVRDYILQLPYFQENGRFIKERYLALLQNQNLSVQDFERQVRKQIVIQKLQELFMGSAAPTREELKSERELSRQKVNLSFIAIKPDDMNRPGFISDSEVNKFLTDKRQEVEKYYGENVVEFSKQEAVHARHILFKIDDKRNAAEAAKLAATVRGQANATNFAKLAGQYSEDPGSKSKGGDLGEFPRGRMAAEFEKAAFSLPVGQISQPIKTAFGYHLILVEKKVPGGPEPLTQVQSQIARKLLARSKGAEITSKIKGLLEKGDQSGLALLVKNAGLKWTDTGEFDLAATTIPKLGEGQPIVTALLKHGKSSGLVPSLIDEHGTLYLVDVKSWKQAEKVAPDDQNGALRMAAYRQSGDLFNAWEKIVSEHANVQKNSHLLQQ